MTSLSSSLLQTRGLKDTLPRRAVLATLAQSARPMKIREIVSALENMEQRLGPVTIYRVIDALEQAGLVHRHVREGTFSLCTQPDIHGHHILLSCIECGVTQETHDHVLCKREEAIAKQKGFATSLHVSELLGTCSHCR